MFSEVEFKLNGHVHFFFFLLNLYAIVIVASKNQGIKYMYPEFCHF